MKVSVVIPAFNEQAFLPRLLESLQKQTFQESYEVIVVDNNSTDKTADIAKKYGARVVFEKRAGYAYACNAGFAAAKGDIIARADADYVQPKQWLEKIYNAFANDPSLIATGGPIYPLESNFVQNCFAYPAIVIWMHLLRLLGRGFLFPNMAVRRGWYEKTGGFDTHLQFGEDTEICLKLKRIGKVTYNPNLYVYTSIRRIQSLGILKTIFGYSFGAQLAMWRGKKVTIGLDVIRDVPKGKPNQYHPWIFLYAMPTALFILVLLLFFLFTRL